MKRIVVSIVLMLALLAVSCSHNTLPSSHATMAQAPAATRPAPVTVVAILVDPQSNAANVAFGLGHHFHEPPDIILVERPQLDRSLEDQRVEGDLAPDAVARRMHLGQPPQADILVTLDDDKQSPDHIDLVACETHHGLRLLAATIAVTGDPAQDAATLQQSISKAIAKSRQDITRIVAIPPMVCSDAARKDATAGEAYSRMLEDAVTDRDGDFVVELKEARAIQHELQLGSRHAIERPMPTYLIGKYADQGSIDARQVTFTLTSKEFGRAGPVEKITTRPGNLRADVISLANRFVGGKTDQQLAEPNPALEAGILNEQARIHEHLDDIDDALNLYDASLLIHPDQLQLHYDLIVLLDKIRVPGDRANAADVYTRNGDQILAIRERQLEQLELWLGGERIGPNWRVGMPAEADAYVRGIPEQFRNTALAIDRARRELYFSVMEARRQSGQTDFYRTMPPFLIGIGSTEESYQVRLRAIRLLKDSPGAEELITLLTWMQLSPAEMRAPAHERFLDEAAKIGGPAVVAAINRAREIVRQMAPPPELPGSWTWKTAPRPLPPGIQPIQPQQPPPLPSEVRLPQGTPRAIFQPLHLSVADGQGNKLNPIQSIGPFGSWLPIGPHVDAVTDDQALYLMKEKGKLQEIFFAPEKVFPGCHPCFDGRYLWAPVRSLDKGQVLVIDPDKGVVARFTQADGLPEISTGASAAGLEPGHACVAGSSGPGWIASLRYDPTRGKRLKVFFDAKLRPNPGGVFGKQQLQSAFTPGIIYTLRGNGAAGKPMVRLLIGRSCSSFPLMVDPVAEAVSIFDQSLLNGEMDTDPTVEKGQLFKSEGTGMSSARVVRYALPDLKPQTVGQLPPSIPPSYPMAFFNGQFNVLAAEHWQTADSPRGPYTEFAGVLPGHYTRILLRSNFYGLILNTEDPIQGLYAVELPKKQ